MIVLAAALLSVLLHWGVGWKATVLAGVAAGIGTRHLHWFAGASGVALGWAVVVIYTAAVAPSSFRVLLDTLGAFGGNIPGEMVVGGTVFVGGILGALGGGIGGVLRALLGEVLPDPPEGEGA